MDQVTKNRKKVWRKRTKNSKTEEREKVKEEEWDGKRKGRTWNRKEERKKNNGRDLDEIKARTRRKMKTEQRAGKKEA